MNSLLIVYIFISLGTFLGALNNDDYKKYKLSPKLVGSPIVGLTSPIYLPYKLTKLKY